MDWYLLMGEGLVLISIIHSVISILANLALNHGISMLADIISLVAEIAILILVKIYFKEEEMYELPAVALIVYMAANLIRIFEISWSYLFFAIPIALMVLMILNQWNMFGIAAGGAMVLVNMIVVVIIYYATGSNRYFSVYFCGSLLNNNSLMGIACILFYLVVKAKRGGLISAGGTPSGGGDPSDGGGISW